MPKIQQKDDNKSSRAILFDEFDFSVEDPFTIFNIYFKEKFSFPLHYHHSFEINICQGVLGSVTLNNKTYRLENDPVLIIPPYSLHSYSIKPNTGTITVLMFSFDTFREYINVEKIQETLDISTLPFTSTQYKKIKEIVSEYSKPKRDGIIDNLQFFFSLMKEISGITGRKDERIEGLDPRIRQVFEYSENNFKEEISIDELSRELDLSKEYFCRFFKKQTGMTYINYLNYLRINHAKVLLKEGVSVTDTCFESGFNNLSYFIKIFKAGNSGLSPLKFQKLMSDYSN